MYSSGNAASTLKKAKESRQKRKQTKKKADKKKADTHLLGSHVVLLMVWAAPDVAAVRRRPDGDVLAEFIVFTPCKKRALQDAAEGLAARECDGGGSDVRF